MNISVYVDKRRKNADGSYGVYLRITADDKKRFSIHTELTAMHDLVDGEFSNLEVRYKAKTMSLSQKITRCREYGYMHNGLSAQQLREGLVEILKGKQISTSIKEKPITYYFDEYIEKKIDKECTAKLYRQTRNNVESFDSTATFSSITPEWLQSFYDYRIGLGKKINGIARHLRDIKAVFNYAKKKGYTDKYPFVDFTIQYEETKHRNILVDSLRNLLTCKVEDYQVRYRDAFFLSLYLWGINFGDMLTLRKEDYKDGYISYDRNKTGKPILIKVFPEAEAIINKYKGKDYLLSWMDGRADYHSFLRQTNEALQKIGMVFAPGKKTTGEALMPSLTTYYARHTVSTLASEIAIPMTTISMSLGHSMKGGAFVTARYVQYQQWMVDDALGDVIKYIKSGLSAKEFIRERQLEESGVGQLIKDLYNKLNL